MSNFYAPILPSDILPSPPVPAPTAFPRDETSAVPPPPTLDPQSSITPTLADVTPAPVDYGLPEARVSSPADEVLDNIGELTELSIESDDLSEPIEPCQPASLSIEESYVDPLTNAVFESSADVEAALREVDASPRNKEDEQLADALTLFDVIVIVVLGVTSLLYFTGGGVVIIRAYTIIMGVISIVIGSVLFLVAMYTAISMCGFRSKLRLEAEESPATDPSSALVDAAKRGKGSLAINIKAMFVGIIGCVVIGVFTIVVWIMAFESNKSGTRGFDWAHYIYAIALISALVELALLFFGISHCKRLSQYPKTVIDGRLSASLAACQGGIAAQTNKQADNKDGRVTTDTTVDSAAASPTSGLESAKMGLQV